MSGLWERLLGMSYRDADGDELDAVALDEIPHSSTEEALFKGRWRFDYVFPEPGDYEIVVMWEDGAYEPLDPEGPLPEAYGEGWITRIPVTATDLPDRTYGLQGASDFDDGTANVRRSGRSTWTGVRTMPRAWAKRGDETRNAAAVAWAAKMRNRVQGRERSRTLSVVPAPWLMPGDVVTVDGSHGVETADVSIDAVTIPLAPGPTGQTLETTYVELVGD